VFYNLFEMARAKLFIITDPDILTVLSLSQESDIHQKIKLFSSLVQTNTWTFLPMLIFFSSFSQLTAASLMVFELLTSLYQPAPCCR